MKTLQNLMSVLLISALSFTSCNKAEDVELIQKVEVEVTTKQMQNEKNPHDQEGALHNSYLDFFAKKMDGKKEMNQDKLLKLYSEFYASQKMDFGDEQINGYKKLFEAYDMMAIGRPLPVLPTNLCRWFPAICDLFSPSPTFPFGLPTGLLNEDNGGTSTERTLKFIEQIKANETKLLADKSLTEEKREALLSQHAVARYSAGYWHNVNAIQKSKSPYFETFQEADVQALCHTCDVVGADAAGAAVGALVGGVGAGPGAAVASGAAVLEKAWKWFWN